MTNAIQLTEEQKELQAQVQALPLIKVVDAATYQEAGKRWKELCAMEKRINKLFDDSVDTAKAAYDAARALRGIFLDPVVAAKKAQPVEMKAWEREEERKRQEAERKAQEAARKAAEDEALARAAALEKEGTPEAKAEAQAIINEPPPVPQVVVERTVPKGFGGATRDNWKARVDDVKALARAVLAGQVPQEAIQGNDKFLGEQVRSLKSAMKWPGVRVWVE